MVAYNFDNAATLLTALDSAISLVRHQIDDRATARKSMLHEKPCDNWSGEKRDKFDGGFDADQEKLRELLRRLRNARHDVVAANGDAKRAEQKEAS